MKAKLIIATGAFALYGMGFLCAALDTAEAAEAAAAPAPAAHEAAPRVEVPALGAGGAPRATDCTAGIRGVTDGEALA